MAGHRAVRVSDRWVILVWTVWTVSGLKPRVAGAAVLVRSAGLVFESFAALARPALWEVPVDSAVAVWLEA